MSGSNLVLVTGGAGFIGSHLVDRLLAEGCEVRVLDDLSTGRFGNLRRHRGNRNLRLMRGNVCDSSLLRKVLRKVDVVFHEAALVSASKSLTDPVRMNEVNATGTLRLLEACSKADVRRLIYASSASVYGEQGKRPVAENAALRPCSYYAVSKLAAENYCKVFSGLGKLETVCLRYFNVYGPRQSFGIYGAVIPAFLSRVHGGRSPVILGDGGQTRDFVNVLDVVEANILAMKAKKAAGGILNIGTGRGISIRRLAEMVVRASGRKGLRPIYRPGRSGDIHYSCADIGKARDLLGYSPAISLNCYLARALDGKGKMSHRA